MEGRGESARAPGPAAGRDPPPATASTSTTESTKVIGAATYSVGSEYPGLLGCRVRVVAILQGARALRQPGGLSAPFVMDDARLARNGGVTKFDRVAVNLLLADGSASTVHWSLRAIDLECFSALRD